MSGYDVYEAAQFRIDSGRSFLGQLREDVGSPAHGLWYELQEVLNDLSAFVSFLEGYEPKLSDSAVQTLHELMRGRHSSVAPAPRGDS